MGLTALLISRNLKPWGQIGFGPSNSCMHEIYSGKRSTHCQQHSWINLFIDGLKGTQHPPEIGTLRLKRK